MKQAKPIKSKDATPVQSMKKVKEIVLILSAAFAIFLFVALITYNSGDAGWSSTGHNQTILNATGKLGALLADIFLYLFGYSAYFFPLLLLLLVFWIFNIIINHIEKYKLSLTVRLVGFILAVLAASSLAFIYLDHFGGNLPAGSGGLVGEMMARYLVSVVNNFGAIIILIASFLVGIPLFTGFSWIWLIDVVGRSTIFIVKYLTHAVIHLMDSHKTPVEPNDTHENAAAVHDAEEPEVATDHDLLAEEASEKKVSKPRKKPEPKVEPKLSATGLPSVELLDKSKIVKNNNYPASKLEEIAREVERKLLDFDIKAQVVAVYPGPVIIRFELSLAPGLKVSKMTALSKDLARALSVSRVRVVEVIPGKSVVGLEIPKDNREMVSLRDLLESKSFHDEHSPIPLVLGKDIAGVPVTVDLARMPHLLVAGTTGSGKSVSLNAMILSILFKSTPDVVRFIMIDPKMLELSIYDGIPHLLTPVVTDMKDAANALRWCVVEMDRRYGLMASVGVRNLASYNAKVKQAIDNNAPMRHPTIPEETLASLPNVVVIVDELADMMMVVGKTVEELIARIAQKARAAGIHMILATQRPSVDVITGLIKSNIPTRLSFQVSSRIDSRTILDQQGAEQLLGNGDMLYLPTGAGHPTRLHGAFVSDDEIHRVVADLKQRGEPRYIEEIVKGNDEDENGGDGEGVSLEDAEQDPLYDQAVNVVIESRRASISYVQRRLRIGYNRAASMLEAMEKSGVVSKPSGSGTREVLIKKSEE